MTRPPAIYRFASPMDVWAGRGRVAASGPTGEQLLAGDAVMDVALRLADSGPLTIAPLLREPGGVRLAAALQTLRAAGIVDRWSPQAPALGDEAAQWWSDLRNHPSGHPMGRPLHTDSDLRTGALPTGPGPLLVVMTGEPADALNMLDHRLSNTTTWLPLQLSGPTPWAGPLFGRVDGALETVVEDPLSERWVPCPHCLALRLRGWREVALAAKADPEMRRVHAAVAQPHVQHATALLTELAHRLAPGGDASRLREASCRSGPRGLTWHEAPRAVCAACRTDVDSTPRSLVERLDRLSDRLTGCLALLPTVTPADGPLQDAVARTMPAARWTALPPPTVDALGRSAHAAGVSWGSGRRRDTAQLKARMEALEGYAGLWRGAADGVPYRAASCMLPAEAALTPSVLLGFSEAQVAVEGPELAALLDPETPLAWCPATGDHGRTVLVPLALAYDGVPEPGAQWWVSNGVAAGATPEGALLHALCELIERDAVAIWWHNALPRPQLPRPDDDDTAAAAVAAHRASGRDVVLLDLTHDLGMAVRAAVTWDAVSGSGMIVGFAADPHPRRAERRALVESFRLVPVYRAWQNGQLKRGQVAPWFATIRIADFPWLLAGPAAGPTVEAPEPVTEPPTPEASLHTVRAALARAGLAPWVIDLTRPDAGIPVVKAFVPGLCFWNRFAPERLYRVPVTLGWLATARTERAMLPFPDGLR